MAYLYKTGADSPFSLVECRVNRSTGYLHPLTRGNTDFMYDSLPHRKLLDTVNEEQVTSHPETPFQSQIANA